MTPSTSGSFGLGTVHLGDYICAALCVTASVWAQWARGIIIVGVQGSSFLVEVGLTCFLLLLSSVNILNLPQFARGLAETLRNFPPDFPIFSSELFSSLEATLHHQCVRVEITACRVCAETLRNVPPDFPVFFRNPAGELLSSPEATLHHPMCWGRNQSMPSSFCLNFWQALSFPGEHLLLPWSAAKCFFAVRSQMEWTHSGMHFAIFLYRLPYNITWRTLLRTILLYYIYIFLVLWISGDVGPISTYSEHLLLTFHLFT